MNVWIVWFTNGKVNVDVNFDRKNTRANYIFLNSWCVVSQTEDKTILRTNVGYL